MAYQEGKPVTVLYDKGFITRDQAVSDLATPRPETRYCLIELPKEDLETLETGQRFRFQEHTSGGAALCTGDKTYSLEFLENSNTQLLGFARPVKDVEPKDVEPKDGVEAKDGVEPKDGDASARLECHLFAQVRGQMFVKVTSGDTSRIRELVGQHELGPPKPAPGPGGDAKRKRPPPATTASLEYQVAASTAELRATLAAGPYVECDDGWKFLPPAFERELLDIALSAVTANGWDKKAVDADALHRAVQEHFGEGGEEAVPSVQVLLKAMRSVIAKPGSAAGAGAEATVADTQATTAPETQKNGNTQPDTTGTATGEGGAGTDATAADTSGSTGGNEAASTQQPDNCIALDVDRVHQFQALQLLHTAPTQVRRRFGLPPPGPRQKRARIWGGNASSGRDGALLLSEFLKAFREISGDEVSEADLLKRLGEQAYLDELEGTVHVLDVATLPQDPRARIKKLFEMASHWRPEKISKLVVPVLGGRKPDPWLMKHTRTVFVEFEAGKEERFITKKFPGI